ncbi:MAG: hypothetical protein JXM69_11205 [Anaerolineae bacterium]|nr:hypothetical protein [Anaerolineae bacterium]
MSQRKTQTPAYWQEQFSVSDQDIEFIYNKILEENRLFSLDDIATLLVKRRCDAEEIESRSELQQGRIYQPDESYTVDEQIIFPLFDFALGRVQYTREARHPDYGAFTALGVAFEKGGPTREFVASFSHPHPLNAGMQSLANLQGMLSPEELYQKHRDFIRPEVKTVLENNDDFVEFHEQYFLNDLLTSFHEGLFNIADAAIDITGGPLSVDALIEQMGLSNSEAPPDLVRFSVNYRLDNDERFDDVGPAGQVLWYLERLEPPEVHHPPRRLQMVEQSYNASSFDNDLRGLLAQIDDEVTNPAQIPVVGPEIDRVTVVLNYPHWRVGTLPLTPKTQSFFPLSHYNPVLFEFVDGRTGNTFPGWGVLSGKYVFGLDQWYRKNKLPVGAYIDIKRTHDPMRVIVDYQATRTQRDWIRMAAVANHRLTFQMNTTPIACKYDDLMIIGDTNQAEIDRLWLNAEEKELRVFDVLCNIFPELSKLNPQSTVHAKTLYSAVNVIRRVSPGLVFQTLTEHDCFIPINHGYWTYDPELRDK